MKILLAATAVVSVLLAGSALAEEKSDAVLGKPHALADKGVSNCTGDACADFDLVNPEYWPGGVAIKSIEAKNYGNNRIDYVVTWGAALGGCNVSNRGTLQPGGTDKINNALAVYVGWCKVTANKR